MPIKRDKNDSIEMLKKAAGINRSCFEEFQEEKWFEQVRAFREKVEPTFVRLDKKMIAICTAADDQDALVLWGARMANVWEHMYEIDRNMAFEGKKQFNWDKVLWAMAWLYAYEQATSSTVGCNRVSDPEPASA